MRKLTLALVAGCFAFAGSVVYAAQGSPADTDKAGRTGPGTASGQMGAADPTPGKAGPGTTKGGAGAASSTAGAGASTGDTGGSSATAGAGGGEPKSRRRARRASRG